MEVGKFKMGGIAILGEGSVGLQVYFQIKRKPLDVIYLAPRKTGQIILMIALSESTLYLSSFEN
jgi:hypothetical protein